MLLAVKLQYNFHVAKLFLYKFINLLIYTIFLYYCVLVLDIPYFFNTI